MPRFDFYIVMSNSGLRNLFCVRLLLLFTNTSVGIRSLEFHDLFLQPWLH